MRKPTIPSPVERRLVLRRTRNALVLAAVASVFTFAAPMVYAQSSQEAAPVAGNAATPSATAPQMVLDASASMDVKPDTVLITLNAEVDAPDQPGAGRKLSAALDDLVKRASGIEHVTVRTEGFGVWPVSNDKGKIGSWRGQGSIVLESSNFEAASALASKLSDKSAISNVAFRLSRQAHDAAERKLLNDAAESFRQRAVAAASAFGFSGYRIVKLDLGGGGGNVMPQPRAMMAMAKGGGAAAPVDVPLRPDAITVSVAVSGTIALQ
ncbi:MULTISPECIES: SIMPL domain-containing protein [unclassified Achromobacter]|uniref:SIMPL domain-containing protein n=1 Tax=unclassified Achromobacter TaxID=2626865 RepID=UPI000B5151B7|nr:hypothetical protein CEY05_19765 [Achromobacter sp. HZ34]OWT79849.1 hypothetical protein CEY04_12210 [Achromobacter sp. HZ28]